VLLLLVRLDAQRERIEGLLAQADAGDAAALGELAELTFRHLIFGIKLRLRRFPRLERRFQPEMVAGEAAERIGAALRSQQPRTLEHLVALGNRAVTWALLDIVQELDREDACLKQPVAAGSADREDGGHDPADPASLEGLEQWEEFHAAALSMGGPEGLTFRLRYYEGFAEAAVAARLGVSERTARTYWARALDELSRSLTGQHLQGERPRLVADRPQAAPEAAD